MLSAANAAAITDKLTALYIAALGTSASALGLGDGSFGASLKASDLLTLIVATGDYDIIKRIGSPADDLKTLIKTSPVIGDKAAALLANLNQACKDAGIALADSAIVNLDTFAAYCNTGAGGPWACLLAPDFIETYKAYHAAYPTAKNVYFEVLQGATYANAVRKYVVTGAGTGTPTAGFSIDSNAYAGGFGQVTVSSFAGSSDTVTVAGNWRKTDGTTATGNGTATVAANGTVVLNPPYANALLISSSSVAAGNNITGGTIYVEAKRPSGRTNPPT